MTPLFKQKYLFALLGIFLAGMSNATLASEATGAFLGAKDTEHPDWFKESFLDFEDDIDEAAAEDKRLVLYFYQAGCPYCNALIEHNFTQRDIVETMQSHFTVVSINMWGDREVVQVGGRSFTEKTLAAALSVNFTPTLLFFDENKKVILRLNGYYPPEDFRLALDWAKSSSPAEGAFSDYLAATQTSAANPTLNNQTFFAPLPEAWDAASRPFTAVYFEQTNCRQCDIMHQQVLSQPVVRTQIDKMHNVQLDIWSSTPITLPDGRQIESRAWAKEMGVKFSPTIIFFDSLGKEVLRMEGAFKSFHTHGIFRYVNDRAYEQQPSFQRYLGDLAEHYREQGLDVNIWSYDLAVSKDNQPVVPD